MGRKTKYTAEVLAPIVASSHSLSEVIRKLGKRPTGGMHRFIAARVRKANLDTSHFVYGRGTSWLDDHMRVRIVELVPECTSVADLMHRIGLPTSGRPHREMTKFLAAQNVDTSHFTGRGWSRGHTSETHPSVDRKSRAQRLPDDVLFSQNAPPTNGPRLAKRLVELGWPYRCRACGISEWQGKPLVLHNDHINGIHNDNRFVNLQLLCPNCHSQTDTYCNRSRGTPSRASEPRGMCYTFERSRACRNR